MVRRGVRNGRRIIRSIRTFRIHPDTVFARMLMKFNLFLPFYLLIFIGSTFHISATMTDEPDCIDSAEIVRLSEMRQVLMSVPDTLSLFWYSTDLELQSANPDAYWLMNRMMQMKVEAESAEEDWAWMQAVSDCMAAYDNRIGRVSDKCASENLAMQDIENLVAHYNGGNQPELNTWTDIMAVLSRFRTINLYERLITSVDPSRLKQGLLREYGAWHRLNRAMTGFMLDYTYAGAAYSALPMDVNGLIDSWSCKRYEELIVEKAILLHDQVFETESSAVLPEKIESLLLPFETIRVEAVVAACVSDPESMEWALERYGTCYDVQTIRKHTADIRTGINHWMNERKSIANMLSESRKKSYMELTKRMLRRFYVEITELAEPKY